jgi:hypothetical protein
LIVPLVLASGSTGLGFVLAVGAGALLFVGTLLALAMVAAGYSLAHRRVPKVAMMIGAVALLQSSIAFAGAAYEGHELLLLVPSALSLLGAAGLWFSTG